ncbi:MAG: NAD(P)H-dependent oxidoreductase subunit E [Actinomycetota bacterium]|nr:NAD(P)H-dependent oxidoreductase subunit E [Actinomycetota bacterium]
MSMRPLHGQTELHRVGAEDDLVPQVLTGKLRRTAEAIAGRYPNSRSATLPLLFLVQSVEGYVSEQGMREVADILHLTPAEVLATSSFYTMLKKKEQGDYLVSVCRNISCTHLGARKIIKELEDQLNIEVGETTADGKVTLEAAECLATCDGAPAMQINYEDFYRVASDDVIRMVETLRRGDTVTSVRGEAVGTFKDCSYQIATVGLRSPGTAGDSVEETFGGESMLGQEGPGFRPKEEGGVEGPVDFGQHIQGKVEKGESWPRESDQESD